MVDLGLLKDDENEIFTQKLSWKDALAKYLAAESSKEEDLIKSIESKTKFADEDSKKKLSMVSTGLAYYQMKKLIQRVIL